MIEARETESSAEKNSMADERRRDVSETQTFQVSANLDNISSVTVEADQPHVDAAIMEPVSEPIDAKMANETDMTDLCMPPPPAPAQPAQAQAADSHPQSHSGPAQAVAGIARVGSPTMRQCPSEQPQHSLVELDAGGDGKGKEPTGQNEGFIVPGPGFAIEPRAAGLSKHTFVKPVSKDAPKPQTPLPLAGDPSPSKEQSRSQTEAPSSGDIAVKSDAGSEPVSKTEKTAPPRFKKQAPAQNLKEQPPLPYMEPKWGGLCTQPYSFEIIKNGKVIDNIDLTTKSFYVFGRLPNCDVSMEHPSLSRYHAVVQYCAQPDARHEGWYLYDLDSTHGTWINKYQVKSRMYHRLKVGFVAKFGGSSRLHILQGPDEDQEEESKLSVAEMKVEREQQKKEKEEQRLAEEAEKEEEQRLAKKALEDEGCSWGMADDVPEEEEAVDMAENPFRLLSEPKHEELYVDDPKKALKGYFEREGYDLPEYDLTEAGYGKHTCRVEVPMDSGQPLVAEVTVVGKKKDAVVACALEACRMLDKADVLRKSTHESRKKKAKKWEDEDYYGSDDDTFLDRTGEIERKRILRMKRLGAQKKQSAETYESLAGKLAAVEQEMASVEAKLEKSRSERAHLNDEDGLDALDAYMSAIKSGAMDTKTKMKLKRQLFELKKQQQQLQKLANLAKPASLPKLKSPASADPSPKSLPLFGKRKVQSKTSRPIKGPARPPVTVTAALPDDGEEEEEEEEEDNKDTSEILVEKTVVDSKERVQDNVEPPDSTSKATITLPAQPVAHSHPEDNASAKVANVRGPSLPPPAVPEEVSSDLPQLAEVSTSEMEDTAVATSGESKSHSPKDVECCEGEPVQAVKAAPTASVKRKKAPRHRPMRDKKAKAEPKPSDYSEDDPDYAVWMPPTGQSGDGRTHLNAKFGY